VAATRTTISLEGDLYKKAVKRAAALGYKSFSAYAEFLLERDVRERGSHIREEPGQYPKKPQKSA
jgi:hypothetical protein